MKILLFSKNGQVARRLYHSLLPIGAVTVFGHEEVDFMNLAKLRECIHFHSPNVIVNAAAYTNVDKAETEIEQAFSINAEAVKLLAEEAVRTNAWLVHYSTDYVFDGTKFGSYLEDDKPNPLNIYGQSKAKGDSHIQASGCKHLILRSSWIFDFHGHNFAKTILNLAKERHELCIVDDQIGSPTSAELIANVTGLMLYKILTTDDSAAKYSGTYNLVASGETSWHGFAYSLINNAHSMGTKLLCLPKNIIPVTTDEYQLPAKRPANSRLDTTKLEQTFKLKLPAWELYVSSLLNDLCARGWL